MYITELISALQLIKAQYGDIEVTVKGYLPHVLGAHVEDVVDPKTAQPIDKIVVLGQRSDA